MHKEIEKAVLKITQAMEKNRNAYNEAKAGYNDTGYDRYYNKMQKLDAEYEELSAFIHDDGKDDVILKQSIEIDRLNKAIKSIKNSIDYMDLPVSSESINLKEMLRELER